MIVKYPHPALFLYLVNLLSGGCIATFGNLFQKYKIISMIPPHIQYSTISFILRKYCFKRLYYGLHTIITATTHDYFTVTMIFQLEAC